MKIIAAILLTALSGASFADTEKHTEFGLSLLSPSLVNFVLKKDAFGLPFQLSGSYWGDIYGLEGGFFLEPGISAGSGDYASPQFLLAVVPVAGYSSM